MSNHVWPHQYLLRIGVCGPCLINMPLPRLQQYAKNGPKTSLSLSLSLSLSIYIYNMYIEGERERERETKRKRERPVLRII